MYCILFKITNFICYMICSNASVTLWANYIICWGTAQCTATQEHLQQLRKVEFYSAKRTGNIKILVGWMKNAWVTLHLNVYPHRLTVTNATYSQSQYIKKPKTNNCLSATAPETGAVVHLCLCQRATSRGLSRLFLLLGAVHKWRYHFWGVS